MLTRSHWAHQWLAGGESAVRMLREAGADVTVHWQNAGHTVTKDELDAAQRWMAERITTRAGGRGR